MMMKSTGEIAVLALLLLLAIYYLLISDANILGLNRYYNTHLPSKDPRFDPLKHCTTPFGTFLGVAHGIPAYSNCHRSFRSNRLILTRFGSPDVFLEHSSDQEGSFISGSPWAATEYVARFLFHTKGITIHDPGTTQEIWSIRYFYNPLSTKHSDNLRKYEPIQLENFMEVKTAKERKRLAPKFADVVVWASHPERELDDGHAAVVVHVEDDVEAAGGEAQLREMQKEHTQPQLVYIAEQNFDNKDWEGKNYSRVLRFSWKNGKEMLLEDSDDYNIIGRVRPGNLKRDDMDEGDL
ncbi:D-alanyl-glycyl endopeptidase-like protein [Trypanosoma theileri]|uniref:D-alanyl-glycyl endopeptidase-like protein n=1 Tax=Trypanosoma theileri TaxID=67003 RepID=A0A1X0NYK9_9TRYP|nr:D-alanyl-glycyl endopeptidase-like protein [Trypanosoma theileri]ORC89638.1 D-alanyl-glycyl endopeptidase-like protein [Trypanosoma theileri]